MFKSASVIFSLGTIDFSSSKTVGQIQCQIKLQTEINVTVRIRIKVVASHQMLPL